MSVLQQLTDDPRVATLAERTTQLLQILHEIRRDATLLHSELQLAVLAEPDTQIDDLLTMGANHFRAVVENTNMAVTALTPVVGNARSAPEFLTMLATREGVIRGGAV